VTAKCAQDVTPVISNDEYNKINGTQTLTVKAQTSCMSLNSKMSVWPTESVSGARFWKLYTHSTVVTLGSASSSAFSSEPSALQGRVVGSDDDNNDGLVLQTMYTETKSCRKIYTHKLNDEDNNYASAHRFQEICSLYDPHQKGQGAEGPCLSIGPCRQCCDQGASGSAASAA
jgi:hypothetical protein